MLVRPFAVLAPLCACAASVAPLGCVQRAPAIECETAGDCDVDERCSDGACVALGDGAEGDGEGDEGEGDIGDPIEAVCAKLATCGSVEPGCVEELRSQEQQMLARGTDACLAAVEATHAAFACLAGEPCDAIQGGVIDPACESTFSQAQTRQDECFGGEGEGEGEGDRCFADGVFDRGNTDAFIAIMEARYDDTQQDKCSGDSFAVGLVIEWDIDDVSQVAFGEATFTGDEVLDFAEVIAADSFIVAGVVCAPRPDFVDVGVILATAAGDTSNPACGVIQ